MDIVCRGCVCTRMSVRRRRFTSEFDMKGKKDYLLFWADEFTHFNYAMQWYVCVCVCEWMLPTYLVRPPPPPPHTRHRLRVCVRFGMAALAAVMTVSKFIQVSRWRF